MTTFSIIGTGTMAKAIGGVLADGGNDVTYVVHEQAGTAPLVGDVVVLAVPYAAVDALIRAYRNQLAGKTVVDITNPLDFETFDTLVVPTGSSAAAQIQAQLPDSTVLKAFNTTFAATLVSKRVGDRPTTVLVAGDGDAAKQVLIDAIAAGGVHAIDAGSLSRAHELEALGFLQLTLAASEKVAWTGGFAVVR